MRKCGRFRGILSGLIIILLSSRIASPRLCYAGGVTVITHGLDGNVDGWVTGMAAQIPNYYRFLGTNYTCYEMYFFYSGGSYYLTADRVGGDTPVSPESGEIIVKLDWRQLADGNSYNTYQIASAVVPALLNTNFIPELGGHALAEFPLHLIGHSRGGSLVCEMSRLLGTNGVWVDHVTTLDPHPLNDAAFPLDFLLYSAVDAPAQTYANVLYHDNYWQNLNLFVYGESVPGAYIRQLTYLDGGYGGTTASHSDVHLWYHGTVDLRVPASDTEAAITSTERSTWWTTYESSGVIAGFYYSLIGRGDRTSTDQPVGAGFGAIRDGYNQWWDLGAGVFDNRTALPSNNGDWPNLILFNRIQTNQVVQSQSTPLRFYYQWTQPDTSNATISIYLDDDLNPLNTNQTLLKQLTVPGNDTSISFATTNITLAASNAAPGVHAFLAKISGGGRSRYLYAPELVRVVANTQPPTLDIERSSPTQYHIGVNGAIGQTLVLQYSTNLQSWLPLATNTLVVTSQWLYTNNPPADQLQRYYRAVLGQ